MQAGAAEKGVPLYKYIAELAGNTKLVRKGATHVAACDTWGKLMFKCLKLRV